MVREPPDPRHVGRGMNHFEKRIRKLEKRAARSARLNSLLGGLVVAFACVAATTTPSLEVIRGQRVEIVDDEGHTTAILGSDDSGGFLSIRKSGGLPVSILGVGPHGGFVTVRSETGIPVSILGSDRKGGYVTVRRRNGIPVLIGQTTEHGGVLQIRDEVGRTVSNLGADELVPCRCQ